MARPYRCPSLHVRPSLQAVADIVRSTLGPKSMLKMMLDPMGGIVITNDGNAILREIDVSHPAAKSMLELARSQDEEVGDGTTSVIILGAYAAIAAGGGSRGSGSGVLGERQSLPSLQPGAAVALYHPAKPGTSAAGYLT